MEKIIRMIDKELKEVRIMNKVALATGITRMGLIYIRDNGCANTSIVKIANLCEYFNIRVTSKKLGEKDEEV